MRLRVPLLLAWLAALAATPRANADPRGDDGRFRPARVPGPSGFDLDLDARADEVWRALTDAGEIRTRAGGAAKVDLRAGGEIATHPRADAKPDDDGWRRERVVTVSSARTLVTAEEVGGETVVRTTRLELLGRRHTRVRRTADGIPAGAAALLSAVADRDRVEAESLLARFPSRDLRAEADAVRRTLDALVGRWREGEERAASSSTWTFEAIPNGRRDGRSYVVRNELRTRDVERTNLYVLFLEDGRWRGSFGAHVYDVEAEPDGAAIWGEYGLGSPFDHQRGWRAPNPEGTGATQFGAGCCGSGWQSLTRLDR
jgi:hypothetical protein